MDLLEAESRGRWWRTGAKWTGRVSTDTDTDRGLHLTDRTTETGVMGHDGVRETDRAVTPTTTTTTATASSLSSHTVGGVVGTEEQRLLRLATKLRMNTSVLKRIFLVVMSSRDAGDALERLQKLDLRGKQDRDVTRVLMECCGHESAYNPYYVHTLVLLSEANRQTKITLQFLYWDFFTSLSTSSSMEEEEEGSGGREGIKGGTSSSSSNSNMTRERRERKIVNLARLLAHLVSTFHTSLSILKPIDIAQATEDIVLFLATFFMALFSSNVSTSSSTVDVVMCCFIFLLFWSNHHVYVYLDIYYYDLHNFHIHVCVTRICIRISGQRRRVL